MREGNRKEEEKEEGERERGVEGRGRGVYREGGRERERRKVKGRR